MQPQVPPSHDTGSTGGWTPLAPHPLCADSGSVTDNLSDCDGEEDLAPGVVGRFADMHHLRELQRAASCDQMLILACQALAAEERAAEERELAAAWVAAPREDLQQQLLLDTCAVQPPASAAQPANPMDSRSTDLLRGLAEEEEGQAAARAAVSLGGQPQQLDACYQPQPELQTSAAQPPASAAQPPVDLNVSHRAEVAAAWMVVDELVDEQPQLDPCALHSPTSAAQHADLIVSHSAGLLPAYRALATREEEEEALPRQQQQELYACCLFYPLPPASSVERPADLSVSRRVAEEEAGQAAAWVVVGELLDQLVDELVVEQAQMETFPASAAQPAGIVSDSAGDEEAGQAAAGLVDELVNELIDEQPQLDACAFQPPASAAQHADRIVSDHTDLLPAHQALAAGEEVQSRQQQQACCHFYPLPPASSVKRPADLSVSRRVEEEEEACHAAVWVVVGELVDQLVDELVVEQAQMETFPASAAQPAGIVSDSAGDEEAGQAAAGLVDELVNELIDEQPELDACALQPPDSAAQNTDRIVSDDTDLLPAHQALAAGEAEAWPSVALMAEGQVQHRLDRGILQSLASTARPIAPDVSLRAVQAMTTLASPLASHAVDFQTNDADSDTESFSLRSSPDQQDSGTEAEGGEGADGEPEVITSAGQHELTCKSHLLDAEGSDEEGGDGAAAGHLPAPHTACSAPAGSRLLNGVAAGLPWAITLAIGVLPWLGQ